MKLTLFLLLCALNLEIEAKENNTLLLGISGYTTRRAPPFQIYKIFSAMPIALETIRANNSVLPNCTLDYVFDDDHCSENKAIDT